MDGFCAGEVVLIARLKNGHVDVFLDQFVDSVFEGAGLELLLEGDGDHDGLVTLVRFVSCHKILRLYLLFDSFNGLRYLRWGGDGEAVQPEKG